MIEYQPFLHWRIWDWRIWEIENAWEERHGSAEQKSLVLRNTTWSYSVRDEPNALEGCCFSYIFWLFLLLLPICNVIQYNWDGSKNTRNLNKKMKKEMTLSAELDELRAQMVMSYEKCQQCYSLVKSDHTQTLSWKLQVTVPQLQKPPERHKLIPSKYRRYGWNS